MPNIKSAKKRMRQTVKRTLANGARKSVAHTARRRLMEAVEGKDKPAAAAALNGYASVLDLAAKRSAIHPNKAARRKSRAARKVAAM